MLNVSKGQFHFIFNVFLHFMLKHTWQIQNKLYAQIQVTNGIQVTNAKTLGSNTSDHLQMPSLYNKANWIAHIVVYIHKTVLPTNDY